MNQSNPAGPPGSPAGCPRCGRGLRRARRRRRHQRRRHRARSRRARAEGRAVREGRSRLAHLVVLDQADPRRAALPRALRVLAGAQGARRARGAAPERAAHHVAAALRDAARPLDAPSLDDPRRPVSLRPPGAARSAAGLARDRPAPACGRRAAAAGLHAGLCLFRRLGRRRAAGRAQCRRRRRARRRPCSRAPRASRRGASVVVAGHAAPDATGASAASPRAHWSMPPAHGRRSSSPSTAHCRTRSRCAWSRAATSSCARLFEHDHAYIFQNPDKRIIFAIPYEGDFTLIGTTDVEHPGAIGSAAHRRRGDRLPLRAGEPLLRAAGHAGRRGVELLGRAAAARRRIGRPVGRDARLPARARHAARRRRC